MNEWVTTKAKPSPSQIRSALLRHARKLDLAPPLSESEDIEWAVEDALARQELGEPFVIEDWGGPLTYVARMIEDMAGEPEEEPVAETRKTARPAPTLSTPERQAWERTQAKQRLTEATADFRKEHEDAQALLVKRNLAREGVPEAEALHKAAAAIAGANVKDRIANLAKAFEGAGLPPGRAQVEAARFVEKQLIAERRAGVTKARSEPSPALAEIATQLRLARVRKGFSQEALATEVGVSKRAIEGYEAGQYAPEGIHGWRLASALGFDAEAVRQWAEARKGG